VETNAGKPGVVDEWTISEAIPVADLMKGSVPGGGGILR
jgi:hypothetical protein